ncbi:MAG: sugar transferase [Gammaproteobacteria bacterium]
MSILGRRPHAVAHNEQYHKRIKPYILRLNVKPGITGLAQGYGCRDETSTLDAMERRVAYDLQYIREWSVLLDFRIIAQTILLVFTDDKAY